MTSPKAFARLRLSRAVLFQTASIALGLALPFACTPGERGFAPTDIGGAGAGNDSGGSPASVGGSPTSGGSGPTGGNASTGGSPSGGGGVSTGGGASTGGGGGGASTGGSASGGGGSNTGPCEDHECLNGGLCSPDAEMDGYTCECAGTGYGGTFCQTEINECDPNPCQEGAPCSNLIADYFCDCPLEFAGKDCSLASFEVVDVSFSVRDLSPDGSVLVGSTDFTAARYVNGTLTELGTYLDDTRSDAWSASNNGTVIVGESYHHLNYTNRAIVWEAGTIVELPPPEGHSDCAAMGVTPDGLIITGVCVPYENAQTVVRWVNRLPEVVPWPAGTNWCFESFPSPDGMTVFGVCSETGLTQPMRWTAGGTSVLLSAGQPTCRMQGSITDGSMGVGWCSPGGNSAQGFVWTSSTGFEQMSGAWLFDPTHNITAANDVSADGQFIVGETGYAGNVNGVVWDETRTPRMAIDLIEQTLGTTLINWNGFQDVAEISADGRIIVGSGSYTPASSIRNFIFRRNE